MSQTTVTRELRRQTITRSFHSIRNVVDRNVVDRGVLQAMWEELASKVVHRHQLMLVKTARSPRLSENSIYSPAERTIGQN